MSSRWLGSLAVLLAGLFAALPAEAQLRPQEPDPLAKIRAAADGQVCSTAETSACAQANPKILAAAMGPSPLEGNLHQMEQPTPHPPGTLDINSKARWAIQAFRDAGIEDVNLEVPPGPIGGRFAENVVAEIPGRDKPDEFVIVGAPLSQNMDGLVPHDIACEAAALIEAARDVHATGLRPLRSIRFVLFFGDPPIGALQYTQTHEADLNDAVAAVVFDRGCGAVNGFSLDGRPELEAAIRDALSFPPIESWDIAHDTPDARERGLNFDFLLEGIPTLLANRAATPPASADLSANNQAQSNLEVLRRNAAVAGILAFALAEHNPPGPRLTRDEIEGLLVRTGLKQQMQGGVWDDWESGKRGRQP